MGYVNHGVCVGLVVVLASLVAPFCAGLTDSRDVAALNSLYFYLEFPLLDKWLPLGGDPCGDSWQGVICVFSNVTELRLSGMNLGGVLSDTLGDLESIINIDLSSNHIGGTIPNNLPLTIRNFSLSDNNFTGSIPESLSSLTQLVDLSLRNNPLSGGIPDCFQQLMLLTNLDLSANNLSGPLPPSMANLSSITTLHLQNNKLSGTLDVLRDLHLNDLNIENNLFSGPIPAQLLAIPNFRKDGNPFNTTIIPSPPTALPPSVALAPSSEDAPGYLAGVPIIAEVPKSANERKFWTTKSVVLIAGTGASILFALGVCLLIYKRCKGRKANKDFARNNVGAYKGPEENPNYSKASLQSSVQMEKVSKEVDWTLQWEQVESHMMNR